MHAIHLDLSFFSFKYLVVELVFHEQLSSSSGLLCNNHLAWPKIICPLTQAFSPHVMIIYYIRWLVLISSMAYILGSFQEINLGTNALVWIYWRYQCDNKRGNELWFWLGREESSFWCDSDVLQVTKQSLFQGKLVGSFSMKFITLSTYKHTTDMHNYTHNNTFFYIN